MSLNKIPQIVVFAVVLGIAAYLASSLWAAIFIVSLSMDDDAITDAVEIVTGEDPYTGNIETRWQPTRFKNTVEELKYLHNARMHDRNRYWFYCKLAVGGLIGFFVFYTVPRWRNTLEAGRDSTDILIGSVILGALVVLIVPAIISACLPAPVHWFPQEICDIAETRQREALSRLEELADEIDGLK